MFFTYVQASSGFSPPDIADLYAWFDPSDTGTIASPGGTLTMTSKEGNSYTLSQSTGGNQPSSGTRTINGLNVLDYDGSDDSMNLSSGAWGIDASVSTRFHIIKSDKTTDTQTIFASRIGGSTNACIRWYDGFDFIIGNNTTSFSFCQKALNPDTNLHVFILKQTGSGAGTISITYDGQSFGTATDSALNAATNSYEFGREGGSDPFDGAQGEVIWYSRALSDSEINQVGQYLADKWGFTWTNL